MAGRGKRRGRGSRVDVSSLHTRIGLSASDSRSGSAARAVCLFHVAAETLFFFVFLLIDYWNNRPPIQGGVMDKMSRHPVPLNPGFVPPAPHGVLKSLLEKPLKQPPHHEGEPLPSARSARSVRNEPVPPN